MARPNPLAAYLAKNKLSVAEFAELVGAHRSQIHRAMRDTRHPSLALAFKIEKATNGAVPASVWAKRTLRGSSVAA